MCLCPFDLDQMGWTIVVMWGLGIRVELGFRIAAMRVKDSEGSKMCYPCLDRLIFIFVFNLKFFSF